jgi:hypothetical protein
MKYVFLFLLFVSLKSSAQVDSSNLTITVQLPVKAIVLYGNYISESVTWAERKTPDILLPVIGSGTKPDSLVTVVVKTGPLFMFISRVISERYASINTVALSIFNNSPAITGYTALFTQISAKAAGNTSEKAAATYLVNRYNSYTAVLSSAFTEMYNRGLAWIRN